MNLLYRNRLVRCYLGATRKEGKRNANPFTGFDPNDDLFLTDFSEGTGYAGPYPLLCAALNVTRGERLAWQERKAESFVFTPEHCGYEFPELNAMGSPPPTYRETAEYAYPVSKSNPMHEEKGGVLLGTAISISGAAASPNMGYHTSPPLAFLMTIFNVRLGWWLSNSRFTNRELRKPEGGPPCSLAYLFQELFAATTDRSEYVYLSDGGHFENLAIYELVRRRCQYIIACDADADKEMKFEDLGNAIRKCRSDFGVEITINPKALQLGKDRFGKAHGLLGEIRYPKTSMEEELRGKILYIKPTITKDVPRDVLAYRDTHAAFPDQTTADQWFDESQFESYRRLGLYSLEWLTETNTAGDPRKEFTVVELFEAARTSPRLTQLTEASALGGEKKQIFRPP